MKCQAEVIASGIGRKVQRCPEPARYRITRIFSGLKTVLCATHMDKQRKSAGPRALVIEALEAK